MHCLTAATCEEHSEPGYGAQDSGWIGKSNATHLDLESPLLRSAPVAVVKWG